MSYTATHAARLKDMKSLAAKVKTVTDGHNTRITTLEGKIAAKTGAQWYSSNPVLSAGNIAITLDDEDGTYTTFSNGGVFREPEAMTSDYIYSPRIKVGDGKTAWRNLKYSDNKTCANILKVAQLSAAYIYALETRASNLESKVTALETAISQLSTALLGITNSVITNVTKED